MTLRKLVLRLGALMVIAARIGSVSCGDLTYRLLAVTKDTVASPYDNATYADFGDIKLFSCLEACRMALTAYPKDEEEIRRNDEISKNRGP